MSRVFQLSLFALIAVMSFHSSGLAQTKKRLDLDDLMIKGEIHNDDRLLILSRQKNELKNHVKFRTNYREEILQQRRPAGKKRDY